MKPAYISYLPEEQCFRYASGLNIYTERFQNGQLLCRDFVHTAIPNHPRMERGAASFELVVDGQSANFDLSLENVSVEDAQDGRVHASIKLKHNRLPLIVTVHTYCSEEGVTTRYFTVKNTGDTAMSLTSMSPLQMEFFYVHDNSNDHLKDCSVLPYSVGSFQDISWGHEGTFLWSDIPYNMTQSVGSNRGKSGHGHPMVMVRNNLLGGYALFQMETTASWDISCHSYNYISEGVSDNILQVKLSPKAPAPMRVMGAGETICSPAVHFLATERSMDAMVQSLHRFQRRYLLPVVGDGLQPIFYNHWSYTEHEIDEATLKHEIDVAAAIGAEAFTIDAGWYGNHGEPWFDTTGDWKAGDRFPKDLYEVIRYIKEKGMKVALWAEVESVGKNAEIIKQHPDWRMNRRGEILEDCLDLTKPEVKEYIETQICSMVERYGLDIFRLDFNRTYMDGGYHEVDGYLENSLWRHMEAVYEIFDHVHEKYPELMIENCASGGARTDIGMVKHFTTTWITDWMKMPRGLRILNGMTLALPPEYLAHMVGVSMNAAEYGEIEAQLQVVLFGHPCFSGLTPKGVPLNPALLELVKRYITIYKEFVRPFHREALVYHHTPVIPGADGNGWAALEYASPDGSRSMAGVWRLLHPETDTFVLKWRGLRANRIYTVRSLPGDDTFTKSGYDLMRYGIPVTLECDISSELFLAEAKDE